MKRVSIPRHIKDDGLKSCHFHVHCRLCTACVHNLTPLLQVSKIQTIKVHFRNRYKLFEFVY